MTVKKKAPVKKKVAAKKKAVAKKKAAPKKRIQKKRLPVSKQRARTRAQGPIPKYKIDHKEWDRLKVMKAICDELMVSSKGIAHICRDNDDFPCIAIVNKWFSDESAAGGATPVLDIYTRAKAFQLDYIVDETIDIGDNQTTNPVIVNGVPLVVDGKVLRTVDAASVQHAKLRCENRRWIAERLAHRKYGSKLEVSSDPERPLGKMSSEQLDAQIQALLAKQDK